MYIIVSYENLKIKKPIFSAREIIIVRHRSRIGLKVLVFSTHAHTFVNVTKLKYITYRMHPSPSEGCVCVILSKPPARHMYARAA